MTYSYHGQLIKFSSSAIFTMASQELEAKITASPESFENGNPLQAIKPLRELLSDAL